MTGIELTTLQLRRPLTSRLSYVCCDCYENTDLHQSNEASCCRKRGVESCNICLTQKLKTGVFKLCFDLNICSILFGKRRQMESRQNKMGECYTRVILFESRVTRIINKQLSSLVDFLTQISLTHFRLKLSVPLGMKF